MVQPLGEVVPFADNVVMLKSRRQDDEGPTFGNFSLSKIFLKENPRLNVPFQEQSDQPRILVAKVLRAD